MSTSRRTLLKNSTAAAAVLSLDWRRARAEAETVRVGVIYDLTGPFAAGGSVASSVGAQIAPWRSRVADTLYGPLREEPDPTTALRTARETLGYLVADQDDQRRVLIERHGNDFSPAELDAEIDRKSVV